MKICQIWDYQRAKKTKNKKNGRLCRKMKEKPGSTRPQQQQQATAKASQRAHNSAARPPARPALE
jgi:hypothetical protein